ncbi:transposase IS200 like protein [bacterium BMS3Abin10]|nr:transposase IS200 like protein [bacterium BMS3Abin10]GBE39225.1 transposase IS200 like protein [bacterium BMS3Bbin08]HDH51740.1 hypothetical protein [Nitrospirota bacterium]
MQRPHFIEDYIYHIFNRGVDKRDVFLDDQDYFRFIHNLFEFNDEEPALNVNYYFDPKTMTVSSRLAPKDSKPRKNLVEIMAFALMPNHFHLLVKQKSDGGITKFMRKLGTGYTNYFNKKYERSGVLFQGKFKAVMLDKQEHLQYLPTYIHLNPLGLNYGSRTSIDWRKGMKFLEEYRWSSFPDYIGKKNFPSVTQRDFILEMFGGEKQYKNHTEEYLQESAKIAEFEALKEVLID